MPDSEVQLEVNSINHPLYLHQNDHPGLILISKKLTGSENYSTWRRSMVIALNAKNKLKIVTGEYKEPDATSNLRSYWERANDMLISWILNTVSEQIGNNLHFINSVASIWQELHDHYAQLDGHRVYQVMNEITQLQQGNGSVEIYYHKLKGLWDELDAIEAPYTCTCKCICENGKINGERDQRKRLIQFLMGLDESYTNIRGQILLLQPLPSVAKAYNMLRQEEKQRGIQKQPSVTPIALNTMAYKRGFGNQSQKQNDNSQSDKRSNFKKGTTCTYCNKEGHIRNECYKIVGYPPSHPLHNKYIPLSQRQSQGNQNKAANMVMGENDTPLDDNLTFSNFVHDDTDPQVHSRIDQLQNQLNQVLLLLQSKESQDEQTPPMAGP